MIEMSATTAARPVLRRTRKKNLQTNEIEGDWIYVSVYGKWIYKVTQLVTGDWEVARRVSNKTLVGEIGARKFDNVLALDFTVVEPAFDTYQEAVFLITNKGK